MPCSKVICLSGISGLSGHLLFLRHPFGGKKMNNMGVDSVQGRCLSFEKGKVLPDLAVWLRDSQLAFLSLTCFPITGVISGLQ